MPLDILFAHPYFPGQFGPLASRLLHEGHTIRALTLNRTDGRDSPPISGVELHTYGSEVVEDRPPDHVLNGTERFIRLAASLAIAANELKSQGFVPDLIYSHSGWGAGAFLKTIFPATPIIRYCEWFHDSQDIVGSFLSSDPSFESRIMTSLLNLPILAEISQSDRLIAPTGWQKAQFPSQIRDSITVIPDGIDLSDFRPDAQACVRLPTGRVLTQSDRVITYVARGADRIRGFGQFIEALCAVQKEDPMAEAIILGERQSFYDHLAGTEHHFRGVMDRMAPDPARTHFLGTLAKEEYKKVLQISAVHVYLTAPYVLSWSALEAMAAGCRIIASNTEPVREFMFDGVNAELVDFFDTFGLARRIQAALGDRNHGMGLRHAARQTIADRWSAEQAASGHDELMRDVLKS